MIKLDLLPLFTAAALLLVTYVSNGGNSTPIGNKLVTGSNNAKAKKVIIEISNAQLKSLLKQKVTLIDIRRPDEWKETGIVHGSLKLTLFDEHDKLSPNFLKTIKQIAPLNKPVVLICHTGNRSSSGAQLLAQIGYRQIYNVTHGITSWIEEGNPVSKP